MGMDVYGRAPKSDTGKYFRNNVWWWHPLWDYCCRVAPVLTVEVQAAHTNEGDGLGDAESQALALQLLEEIESGRTLAYEEEHEAQRRVVPPETCQLCNGTGVRTDELGMKSGQPDMIIGPEEKRYRLGDRVQPDHPRYGQQGWCNGCNGIGTKASDRSRYAFSVDNVREFAAFLRECGGFAIK